MVVICETFFICCFIVFGGAPSVVFSAPAPSVSKQEVVAFNVVHCLSRFSGFSEGGESVSRKAVDDCVIFFNFLSKVSKQKSDLFKGVDGFVRELKGDKFFTLKSEKSFHEKIIKIFEEGDSDYIEFIFKMIERYICSEDAGGGLKESGCFSLQDAENNKVVSRGDDPVNRKILVAVRRLKKQG